MRKWVRSSYLVLWTTLLGARSLGASNLMDANLMVRPFAGVPPSLVADLRTSSGPGAGQIRLQWTAPAVFPGSVLDAYQLRIQTFSVADAGGGSSTWWNMQSGRLFQAPYGESSGNSITRIIGALPADHELTFTAGTSYYFSVRSADDISITFDLWSESSNYALLDSTRVPPAPDTTPPAVAITTPADGIIISSQSVTVVSASASDNVGVAGVQFKLDGQNLGAEDTAAPYAVAWNTALVADGTHTLTAVARDAAGNAATSIWIFVTVSNQTPPPSLDITPPAVAIITPVNGATVSGVVGVSATAYDNVGVVGVQFRLDGANLGVEDTTAPYSASLNSALIGNGSHILTTIARDAAGNTATSANVTITVSNSLPPPPPGPDTTAPSLAIIFPADGSAVMRKLAVYTNASDNVGVAKVELWADGSLAQTVTLNPALANFTTKLTWKAPMAGFHALKVLAYDEAGNTGQSSTLRVQVQQPLSTPVRNVTGLVIVGILAANQAELALSLDAVPAGTDFTIVPEFKEDDLVETMKRADEKGRGMVRVGAGVEIEAVDTKTLQFITKFAKAGTLTLQYDPAKVTDPRLVGVFYWDEGLYRWQAIVGQRIDTVNHTVSVQLDHLTTFAVYEISPSGTAVGSLEFGEVFAYPNPAKRGKVTIHVELPVVDSVEIRIYDLNGRLIHRAQLDGAQTVGINGKQAYEYVWNTSGIASGSYMYLVQATKGSQAGRILKKLAIVK